MGKANPGPSAQKGQGKKRKPLADPKVKEPSQPSDTTGGADVGKPSETAQVKCCIAILL